MKVSLILDCKEESLAQVMQGIQGQEYEPYEVAFLTHNRGHNLRMDSPDKYNVICLRYKNLVEGKRRAACYASGELICFMDSDVLLEPQFLSHWVAMFKVNPDIYAVGPGVQMFNRMDYLDCSEDRSNDELIFHRMHKYLKNIRVENSNYVSTIEIQNLII